MHATSPYVAQVIAAQRQEELVRASAERRLARRLSRRTPRANRAAADL
ncbi:hypothetical protein HNR19_002621 [Nocardioides thalensis]|uniref:Uncharacterized protein n=1 Tax=Nocardioides thalensis TaxID=1914755 RepID=A0A853C6U3_9ACTN|nr:hypothetical protein [Nocardioides thalensis]NYJ01923.1 hypothetical protein [Nocardioides thalensis]